MDTKFSNLAGQVGFLKRKNAHLESQLKKLETTCNDTRARTIELQKQLDTMVEKQKKFEDETNLKIVHILRKK